MKLQFVRAVLVCATFLVVTPAMATNLPIPGVDIIVCKNRPKCSLAVEPVTSDGNGEIVLNSLEPGDYVIEVDGKSLVAAVDRLVAPPPKKSGGGFSIGVGGFLGGGSNRSSSSGAAPGGPGGGSRSGGGVGLSIPLGGGDSVPPAEYPITSINISLPANPDDSKVTSIRGNDQQSYSVEIPYCRDAAIHGLRLRFTVPKGSQGPLRLQVWQLMQGQNGAQAK